MLIMLRNTSLILIIKLMVFFFSSYGDFRNLHSFPTRRSSDLYVHSQHRRRELGAALPLDLEELRQERERSEEHTSELQSRPHLVCRLLLEKKKHAGLDF